MNMNAVADVVMGELSTLHARVYRNEPPQSAVYPYVVCWLESSINSGPSSDIYANINIIDDPHASSRAIETIADTIENAIDERVVINSTLNLHAALEQRQYISNRDLTTGQMVNLRFVLRVYFK